MHQYAVAFSTAGDQAKAQELAKALVTRGTAACVTIIPKVESYYKWKGELCVEPEWLLLIKTRFECQAAIEKVFLELHPYDVPELILLPVEAGKTEYLEWLDAGID